jgi:hypothetical protein
VVDYTEVYPETAFWEVISLRAISGSASENVASRVTGSKRGPTKTSSLVRGPAVLMNRRTLQRDLKLLVKKGSVHEVGTSPTDPTKYCEPLL